MNEDQRNREETAYMNGSRMAWLLMLGQCLRHLGYDDPDVRKVAWVTERTEAIHQLRDVCGDFGDNDWPDELSLADVIEKHLARHLHAS
jgi:predicted secreted protein